MLQWFNNLKTGVKLIGSFLLMAALILVVAAVGYLNMRSIDQGMTEMYKDRLMPIEWLGQAEVALMKIRGDAYIYYLLPEQRQSTMAALEEDFAIVEDNLELYRETYLVEEEVEALATFDSAWAEYREAVDGYLALVDAGEEETALESVAPGGDVAIARGKVGTAMDDIIAINARVAEELQQQGQATMSQATRIVFGAGIVGMLLAVGLGLLISNSMTGPLAIMAGALQSLSKGNLNRDIPEEVKNAITVRSDEIGITGKGLRQTEIYLTEMVDFAKQIADYDLTADIQPRSDKDELGHALRNMVERLREAIGTVQNGADSVTDASGQLARTADAAGDATQQVTGSIEQVAKGAAQAAEATNEANRGLEELNRAIDGVAKGAQEAAGAIGVMSGSVSQVSESVTSISSQAQAALERAASGRDVAKRGLRAVQQTMQGMEEIKKVVEEAIARVREMGERSQEVGKIVGTIEDIAEQTNLLALNAQIEAARAGEQGRGFAVVADEVRKLAERSARATQEIAQLVSAVQNGAEGAVEAIGRGGNEVGKGVELAQESEQVIQALERSAEEVAGFVAAVSRSAAELAEASERMSVEVERVSAVVEESSASSEEMAASSTQVSEAASSVASVNEELSASAEEVAASAEELAAQIQEVNAVAQSLAQQATDMQRVVDMFRLSKAIAALSDKQESSGKRPAKNATSKEAPVLAAAGSNGHR